MRCGEVTQFSTELIREVFLSCTNLRIESVRIPTMYEGEEDPLRTLRLESRAVGIIYWRTSEHLPDLEKIFDRCRHAVKFKAYSHEIT